MSGQPYRYVKDVENFRNEYMEALNLRANIDDMNYQANKNYLETGALPPRSTMKDMRSTAEILMDVEKLKINIIAEFKGVATPQMIQLVLQRVQASPLNGDGSFLVWLAQNVKELVPQIKKKYSYGIAGDANDAENMYLFIQDMFSKTKDINTTLKSAFDRPIGSDNIGINAGDFAKLKAAYDEISLRLVSSPNLTVLKNKIRDQFEAVNDFILPKQPLNNPSLPPDQQAPRLSLNQISKYDQLKQHFQKLSSGTNAIQQTSVNSIGFNKLIEYTDKLPAPAQVRTIIDQLKRSENNANPDLSIQLLGNLSSILPSIDESNEMNRLSNQILSTTRGQTPLQPTTPLRPTVPNPTPPINAIAAPTTQQTLIMRTLSNKIASVIDNILSTQPPSGDNVTDDHAFANEFLRELNNVESQMDNLYPNWEQTVNYDNQIVATAVQNMTNQFDFAYSSNQAFRGNNIRDEIKRVRGVNTDQMIGAGLKRAGRPRGSGIVKPISERIDNTKGIKQGHTHVPFGKYILNKNRLDDDIFSFKHVKGYGVKGYPSKKISRNLSNVIKTIIGGGVPKFNELSNLSEDEKEYLHTVSSKAGIMDKLSVPTPSKDSMEQDVHQFNVMKGEILAGNDSSQLIKKFKLLLLKLSKNGSLPKRECQEIMEDLIQLGY
jgi:hypothetical protein